MSSPSLTNEVYFLDFGNRHTVLNPRAEICSMDELLEQAKRSYDQANVNDIKRAACMPAQVHCCRLADTVARTEVNLKRMQKLMAQDTMFDIDSVLDVQKYALLESGQVELLRYTVSLSQNGVSLNETLDKTFDKVTQLKPGEKLECKLAYLDAKSASYLFVNLTKDSKKIVNTYFFKLMFQKKLKLS